MKTMVWVITIIVTLIYIRSAQLLEAGIDYRFSTYIPIDHFTNRIQNTTMPSAIVQGVLRSVRFSNNEYIKQYTARRNRNAKEEEKIGKQSK